MIVSGIFYGIIFIQATLLYAFYQKIKSNNPFVAKGVLFLSFILPILAFCLRDYSVGWDTKRYVPIYDYIKKIPFKEYLLCRDDDINCRWELGYYWLNRFAYLTFDSYRVVLLLAICIMLFFTYKAIGKLEHKKYACFSIFIFYLTIYTQGMDTVRFSIGCSISLFAFTKLLKKKYVEYIIWIICACFFQKIFIILFVYLALIPLRHKKLNDVRNFIYYVCILCSPLILKIVLFIMSDLSNFSYYFTYYSIDYKNGGVGFLKDILPVLPILWLYYKKMITIDRGNSLLYHIAISTIPLCYVAYYIPSAVRMKRISYLSFFLLIPTIAGCIYNKKYRFLLLGYYSVVFIFYYIFEFIIFKSGGQYPYLFMG